MNFKRGIVVFSLAVLIVFGVSFQAMSQTKAVNTAAIKPATWKFSNFLPPGHFSNWCNSWLLDEIERKSGGKIKGKLYIGEALGKAAEHYTMVVTGRAEIGELTTGFAPGTFPLSPVLQLPYNWHSSLEGSLAANDMFRHGFLDDTLRKDVKLIAINMTIPLKIWTKKPVTSFDGLKGLRLRVAGGMDIATIESLGANAIAMPLPEVYPALEKGVIDGGVYGEENAVDFKYAEVAKYVIDQPLCYAVHLIFMNKKVWDGLPKDFQAALDETFRETEVRWGLGLDILMRTHYKTVLKEKYDYKIVDLSAGDVEKMKNATSRVKDDWIAATEKKGLPGKKNYEGLVASMKNLGVMPEQSWVKNRALQK